MIYRCQATRVKKNKTWVFHQTCLVWQSRTIRVGLLHDADVTSSPMIVTATCCVAFVDNVYLQYLADISILTLQIKQYQCRDSVWWPVSKFQNNWTCLIYATELQQTHKYTAKEQSYTQYNCTWQTVNKQKTSHGLAHTVRWFLEICLTQLHIRTNDSCSGTSQDVELGGRINEGSEAISCQDHRTPQSDGAKSRKWFIFSWLWLGYQSSDDWCCFDCLFSLPYFFTFFFQHTLQPVKQKWTDFYTIWLERQMGRLTPVSVIVWIRDKDRLQWKETSSCLSRSLLILFFSEDIDEQTPCSKTQWPHGTSQTTAAGKPKI